MFGSNVLEVGIGLVFVYWLLSLLCSTINEQVIVPLLKLRAKFLEEGIKNLLSDPQGDKLVNDLYNKQLIKGLSRQTSRGKLHKPSYIPGDTFALALMSMDVVQVYKDNPAVANSPIPDTLKSLFDKAKMDPLAKNDPTKVLAIELTSIEKWYNDAMDRVTGWYKRRVQLIIFLLGCAIVITLNVDTISLITNISNNTVVRSTIVSAAQGSASTQPTANLEALQKSIAQISPVIGWSTSRLPTDVGSWFLKIVGLLATIFAVSLGAPFWFDLLNKFMAFRSSGPPPQPRTGPSESTGTPQQLAVTVTGAPPNVGTPPAGSANGLTDAPAPKNA
jgi:hypothetical protein